ncbi:MAG: arsenite methyltransferase [Ectothiorhodospiraceae bacterium]|jgi:ubiquinone/menaquinone biosynthesis C-methylase UbiE
MKWDTEDTRTAVRGRYSDIANAARSGNRLENDLDDADRRSATKHMGYSDAELDADPGGNLGLGCGNPLAASELQPGMTVLDLGSGGGFDAFIAAREVGPEGRVIGVDMSEDMVALARRNAAKAQLGNTEFRVGYLEALPLDGDCVDAVISNCVVNLCPDKSAVFREAHRVLRPGGWLSVTDVLLDAPLPAALLNDLALYAACISGAVEKAVYLDGLREAGFESARILRSEDVMSVMPDALLAKLIARIGLPPETLEQIREGSLLSAHIHAVKPQPGHRNAPTG